jgi:RNA polymerase sigma factor (sigma-70 family)
VRAGQLAVDGSGVAKADKASDGPDRLPGTRRLDSKEVASSGDLVRLAAKGDERAWAQLMARFGPMVLRVASGTGLNAADAADVQQVTWMQLMRRADQVREPERIAAWLVTTARRQSQRIAMRSCRQQPSPDPLGDFSRDDAATSDVEAQVLKGDYEPELERALGRLPASYQRILQLLASDPTPSYEEVARTTGLALGSIGPMRMRALQQLRRDPELQRRHCQFVRLPAGSSPSCTPSSAVSHHPMANPAVL